MVYQKFITIQDYKNSKEREEYRYLQKKDDEIKKEHEGIIKYGSDFKNCKINHDRDST